MVTRGVAGSPDGTAIRMQPETSDDMDLRNAGMRSNDEDQPSAGRGGRKTRARSGTGGTVSSGLAAQTERLRGSSADGAGACGAASSSERQIDAWGSGISATVPSAHAAS